MALVTMNRNQFDVAEGHCHRCLANARRLGVEGEDKNSSTLEVLATYLALRQRQAFLNISNNSEISILANLRYTDLVLLKKVISFF
jgi:hypothetical protein